MAWALVATLAVLGVLLLVRARADPAARPDSQPAPSSMPRTTAIDAVEGPQPPATGAWFGAWTKPVPLTQEGRIAAVASLEDLAGRELDVVHTYRKWSDPFPTQSDLAFLRRNILQLSWAGTDTRSITSGQQDSVIRERARAVKAVDVPLLLEWRWEMDRPNLQAEVHSPQDYVAAWLHIRDLFRQEGVHNAGWVWCPLTQGFSSGRASAYYPGDDQVDWLCVDAYPDVDVQASPRPVVESMAELLEPFLRWASGHPKPILIGEYGVPQVLAPAERAEWLSASAATFRAHSQIRGVSYYDENPKGNPAKYDYAIGPDRTVRNAFRAIAMDPYFRVRRTTGD